MHPRLAPFWSTLLRDCSRQKAVVKVRWCMTHLLSWSCIGRDELMRGIFILLGSYSCGHHWQLNIWQMSKKLISWELTASVAAVKGYEMLLESCFG